MAPTTASSTLQFDLFDALLTAPAVEARPTRSEAPCVEESKVCGGCKEEKPLVAFARDLSRGDGRKTMCRSCDAIRYRQWVARMKAADENWVATRTARKRELQRQLNEGRPPMTTKSRPKRPYPNKAQAAARAAYPDVGPDERRHHWSYREEHWEDIFILPREDHYTLHRFMRRDHEHLCFRTFPGGVLLDTRAKHLAYAEEVLGRLLSG
jgi:hypothetical protein